MKRALLVAVVALTFSAPAHAAPTRYSLAHGCYRLDRLPAAGPVRMQPTTLGRYLLYRANGTYVAARSTGAPGFDAAPSPAADWRADKTGGALKLTPQSGQPALDGVHFTPATGCAKFPEAELDATGRPVKGATPYGRVTGVVDGHMHWMTFEYLGGNFHCGLPWSPYGIATALPDCSSIEGPGGVAAPFQNFLNYGNPAQPHDTRGFPQMTSWSASNLTYEGTYWRWIQRAYLGGLRLMVMSVNENRILCSLQANRTTDCDEMETVRRGLDDIRELQRYTDAQAGGPGKGFFQIVTDPYAARRVINAGKMAVVLEIEVSEPFGCHGWDTPSCDAAQVDRQLDDLYQRGVRSALLLNKFDNPLTGVRFDSGTTGLLINGANFLSAGSFWSAKTCTGQLHDNTIQNLLPGSESFVALLNGIGVPTAGMPLYGPAPHCNTRGLTPLGAHAVERMMDRHMIVNPDHMSQAGVEATLSLLEARGYSGVISPHGWMDPGNWPRLWKLGGLAFPGHSSAADYVAEWKQFRPQQTPYAFGWGYGADLGGLSLQPDPSPGLTYPFKSLDGSVTFQRQRTGDRTFDYPREGVAHYGLYADWFADLARLGGPALTSDLLNGAEAYLEMWERADGVPAPGCAPATRTLTRRGLGAVRLGATWPAVLRRAGQPQQRARAWAWCVPGGGADVAVLDRRGRVAAAGSTAGGRTAGGVAVGDPMAGAPGLHTRNGWAYSVSRGRVAAVAVARRGLSRGALRATLRQITAARANAARHAFAPNARAASGAGAPLAGTGVPHLDAALALLCNLQGA